MGVLDIISNTIKGAIDWIRTNILKQIKPEEDVVPSKSPEEIREEYETKILEEKMKTPQGLLEYVNQSIEFYKAGHISQNTLIEILEVAKVELQTISALAGQYADEIENTIVYLRRGEEIQKISAEPLMKYQVGVYFTLVCKKGLTKIIEYERLILTAKNKYELYDTILQWKRKYTSEFINKEFNYGGESCMIVGIDVRIIGVLKTSQQTLSDFEVGAGE